MIVRIRFGVDGREQVTITGHAADMAGTKKKTAWNRAFQVSAGRLQTRIKAE
jgi:hypothetical protein